MAGDYELDPWDKPKPVRPKPMVFEPLGQGFQDFDTPSRDYTRDDSSSTDPDPRPPAWMPTSVSGADTYADSGDPLAEASFGWAGNQFAEKTGIADVARTLKPVRDQVGNFLDVFNEETWDRNLNALKLMGQGALNTATKAMPAYSIADVFGSGEDLLLGETAPDVFGAGKPDFLKQIFGLGQSLKPYQRRSEADVEAGVPASPLWDTANTLANERGGAADFGALMSAPTIAKTGFRGAQAAKTIAPKVMQVLKDPMKPGVVYDAFRKRYGVGELLRRAREVNMVEIPFNQPGTPMWTVADAQASLKGPNKFPNISVRRKAKDNPLTNEEILNELFVNDFTAAESAATPIGHGYYQPGLNKLKLAPTDRALYPASAPEFPSIVTRSNRMGPWNYPEGYQTPLGQKIVGNRWPLEHEFPAWRHEFGHRLFDVAGRMKDPMGYTQKNWRNAFRNELHSNIIQDKSVGQGLENTIAAFRNYGGPGGSYPTPKWVHNALNADRIAKRLLGTRQRPNSPPSLPKPPSGITIVE